MAGVVLYWSLGGSWARKLALLVAIPLVAGLNVAYMSAIPAFFLIEDDTAPETRTWTEHCFVERTELRAVRTSTGPVGAHAAWVVQTPAGRDALLRLPDCSITPAVLPVAGKSPEGFLDFFLGFPFATPDGVAIIEQTDRRSSVRIWWRLASPSGPLHPLLTSSERVTSSPVLSPDGTTIAYLETLPVGPPVTYRALVRKATETSTVPEVDIDLAAFGRASWEIVDVDPPAREVLLWRDDRPVAISFDGRLRSLPFEPGGLRAQSTTYRRVAGGWIAWDAYRDEGPYQIAWSIAGKPGRHRTNAGRSVTSAAVDPTGRFVAISETTALSVGSARDVVYVLSADTGVDAFRTYLPRYTRSQVRFFEDGLFGYSDLTGTHILKID